MPSRPEVKRKWDRANPRTEYKRLWERRNLHRRRKTCPGCGGLMSRDARTCICCRRTRMY